MTLVAIVPKIVVKNLFFLLSLKLGNINPFILQKIVGCLVIIINLLLIKFYIGGNFSYNALYILIGNFSLRCLNDYTLGQMQMW